MIPEPKFRLIIFGDGEVAEEIDKSPEEEEGVMGWKYIINPSEKLVKNYNLEDVSECQEIYQKLCNLTRY